MRIKIENLVKHNKLGDKGAEITGLKKEDFSYIIGGEEVEIKHFEDLGNGSYVVDIKE